MFSLICARINGSINNLEAGDMRRHRAHYDVIVMLSPCCSLESIFWRRLVNFLPGWAGVVGNMDTRAVAGDGRSHIILVS